MRDFTTDKMVGITFTLEERKKISVSRRAAGCEEKIARDEKLNASNRSARFVPKQSRPGD